MNEKLPKQLPTEETPEQLLEKGGDTQYHIRAAFYDVFKMLTSKEREVLDSNLTASIQDSPEEIEETERRIEDMKRKDTDEITISNWQEGLKQKKSELIYCRLAKEALKDVDVTGKGAE